MRHGPGRLGALGVAGVYALFAVLWILLSDLALELWLDESQLLVLAGTLKGWLFVLVTAALLYGLLRRFGSGSADPAASAGTGPRRYPWLQFAGLALAIAVVAASIIFGIVRSERQRQAAHLATIADLKAQQVGDWLTERLADAQQLHSSKLMAQTYQRWRREGDPALLAILAERLTQIMKLKQFNRAMLLDGAGAVLWSSVADLHHLEPLEELLEAARGEGAGWRGPYRDPAGDIHLHFFATLALPEGEERPIVVMHADDNRYLPATLNVWPLRSETGEVVLFRREADQIVFLNALRHDPDAALKLRRPVRGEQLLAGKLASDADSAGHLLEWRDYHGVAAVGAGRAVPGTDWYLIAKLDWSEFYHEAIKDSLWVAIAGAFALFTAAATLYLGRQRRQLDIARAVQGAQAENLRALRLMAAIADASADAIFAKDREGRYLLFNRAATAFTGKTADEVLGRDDTALFPAGQAAKVRANDRSAMDEDRVVSYEETLDTPQGPRTFLALKGALHGDDGQVIGIYGIARDITERSAADAELRRSHEELSRFNRAMVGRELEMVRLKREINALARALGRPAPYDVSALEAAGPGDDAPDRVPGGGP